MELVILFVTSFQGAKSLINLSQLKFSSEYILFDQTTNEFIHDVFHFPKVPVMLV